MSYALTLIVAWRDPFCLAGDSLATPAMFAQPLPPVVKIRVLRCPVRALTPTG
jgi:hypothetical protein